MYSILIADDEPVVVDCMREDIKWDELDISDVFSAYSGEQALSILNDNHVDVILTDIRMPGIDGIELADIVQKKWPFTKTIFLSGYNDFEYAQKAVAINIFSYILKPAPYSEVCDVVRLALRQIDKQLARLAYVNDLDKRVKIAQPVLKERLLAELLSGNVSIENMNSLKEVQVDLVDKKLIIIAVCIDKENITLMGTKKIETIRTIISNMMFREDARFHFTTVNDRIICILEGVKNEEENDFVKIEQNAELTRVAILRNLNLSVSIFWTAIIDKYEDVASEFKTMDRRIYQTASWQSGILEGPREGVNNPINSLPSSLSMQPDMKLLLKSGDKNSVIKRLDIIFDEISKTEDNLGDVLLGIYHQIIGEIMNASIENGIPITEWLSAENNVLYGLKPPYYALNIKEELYKVITAYLDYYQKHNMRCHGLS